MKSLKPVIDRLAAFTPVGHRGAGGELPGNTMESFSRLLEIFPGAMIELDVWRSSDGVAVVFHDRLLDHETNGTGPVEKYAFQDLRRLDRAFRITRDRGKTFPLRGNGYRIPSLEEVLKNFSGSPLSIDIKYHTRNFAAEVADEVESLGARERAILGSFSSNIISYIRKRNHGIATSCTVREAAAFYLLGKTPLWKYYRFSGDILMIPEFSDGELPEFLGGSERQGFRIITHGLIRRAHEHNVPVIAWTINRKENMERLISWGIDGIVTDYPAILEKAVSICGACIPGNKI